MTQPSPAFFYRFSYGLRVRPVTALPYPWAVMDGSTVVALAATEDAAKELVVQLYLNHYPGGAA